MNEIDNSKKKIGKNLAWNLSYRVVTMLTPLITSPYISRVLGASGVGTYSYNFAVANYFMIFALLGVSDYGIREIAKCDKGKRDNLFCEIYYLQIFLSLLTCSFYLVYCFTFSKDFNLSIIFLLNVISVTFDVTWFFFGVEDFKIISLRNIIIKVLMVILIVTLVKEESQTWLYCLISCCATFLSQIMVLPALRKYVKFKIIPIKNIFKHLKPNLILFLPVISSSLLNYSDKIMLGQLSSYSELGYYESAEKVIQIPNSLVTALGTVMLSRVSNLVENKADNLEIKNLTNKSLSFTLFFTIAFAFGISAISSSFVPVFFGEGFTPVIILLYILSPTTIFISMANVIKTQSLLPFGKDKKYTLCLSVGVIFNIILNAWLIPLWGSAGASIATLISEIIICVMGLFFARNTVSFKRLFSNFVLFFLFGCLMFLSIYWINFSNQLLALIIKILLGALVYIILGILYLYIYKMKKGNINHGHIHLH